MTNLYCINLDIFVDADTDRRYYKSNRQYILHLQRLREVNGLKTHNLEGLNEGSHESPVVYINNPVESRIPHPYLTVDQYKDAMINRVLDQKKEFTNREFNKRNKLFVNTNKKFKPIVLINHEKSDRIFSTTARPKQSEGEWNEMYNEVIYNFTSDILNRLESKIIPAHKKSDLIPKKNTSPNTIMSVNDNHTDTLNKPKQTANKEFDDNLSEGNGEIISVFSENHDKEGNKNVNITTPQSDKSTIEPKEEPSLINSSFIETDIVKDTIVTATNKSDLQTCKYETYSKGLLQ